MFDTERLTLRGRLAEKESQARHLTLSILGDISAVRALLPPFAELEELRANEAATQAVELASKHAEYVGLMGEIRAMKKALGV